ncbi:MAG: ribonuclease P protein component [Acidothermus sp.]|nr:ribonuclease P protein component [Acidothermus sp.]
MLPAWARLRCRKEFQEAIRRGRRLGGRHLVVHFFRIDGAQETPVQAGFVVGRGVGKAVVRNKVRRRLRHLVRQRLGALPPGTHIVVRALPGAEALSSRELGNELDEALGHLQRPRR